MIFVTFRKYFDAIFDILEKKDPEVLKLEKQDLSFWAELRSPNKIGENIIYFFPYQNKSVKKAILEIKARNDKKLRNMISALAAENLLEELAELRAWRNFSPEIAIPIPPSGGNKGFNHSEEIARAMLEQNMLGDMALLKNILIKTRSTPIQHSLSREKRLQNLKNSMTVKNPEKIKDKEILLVDDITTTGATFEEAARALREAGSGKVFCVALAH